MKKNTLLLAALVAALIPSIDAQTTPARAPAPLTVPKHYDPSVPAQKDNGRFIELHNQFLARGKEGPIGVLFLGDSITEGWNTRAKDLFNATYGKYQPGNFGISGDTTQGVLWRIDHGELDGIHPKVLVYMLGTNNSATATADEIILAENKVIGAIRAKLPDTKILLLAIFPRGPRNDYKAPGVTDEDVARTKMAVITEVNHALASLDDGKTIRFLDIGPSFLDANGKIPKEIMNDALHPTLAGYQIWVKAMDPLLTEMMAQ